MLDDRVWYALGAVGVAGLVAWWWSTSGSAATPQIGAMPLPAPGQPGAAPETLTLPALPYPATALAPIVSERTVTLHHGVHQRGYVDGVNRDLAQLYSVRQQAYTPEARRPMRRSLAESLSYNLGGAYLHDLYWRSLAAPGQGGAPSPQLTEQIQRDFGSIGMLAEEMTDVGMAMQGSGWVLLAYSPYLGRLIVLSVANHDNRVPPGIAPLLPLDVWEHAYYLDHGPDRSAYLRQFWGIVNWTELSRRFAAVMGQRLPVAAVTSPSPSPRTPPSASRPTRPAAATPPRKIEEDEEDLDEDQADVLAAERHRLRRPSARLRARQRKAHREAMARRHGEVT